jgi:hypothetical protein
MSLGGSPDRRKGGRCGPHPETAALIATRIVPTHRTATPGLSSSSAVPVDRLERRGSNEEPEGPTQAARWRDRSGRKSPVPKR